MDLEVTGEIWHWRGPAPYYFVTVPADTSARLKEVASAVTYGWGMVPVLARVGDTEWETSLWPKDGGYIVPIKDAFRKAERLALGDVAEVELSVRR
jgi:hypothetical protein